MMEDGLLLKNAESSDALVARCDQIEAQANG